MPSPFPGMNPYLEHADAWHDFHSRFLPLAAILLTPQVRPRYIVKIDEQAYVHENFEQTRSLLGRPDVGISLQNRNIAARATSALLTPPAIVELLTTVDIERNTFIEILDRESRNVVTVIELLSPTNKASGPNRQQYLTKRGQILTSQTHFVEIDLLRGGQPMPVLDRPPCDYSILVHRAEEWPRAGFWPIYLGDRLPAIPIPLQAGDDEAQLDLQAIVHRIYDEAAYEDYLYESRPEPALTPNQAEWAKAFLPVS